MFQSFPSGKGGLLMRGRLEEREVEWRGRETPRRKLFLAASVEQADAGCLVDVFNISETGMLLGTSGKLDLDEPITVVLPDVGERSARIVWYAENLYGCRFEEPLDEESVKACLAHSSPEGPVDMPAAAPPESFGARLKRLRSQSRYSMVELAKRVGVTKPTLWKWETGKVMPRQAALERLAAELGLGAAELLYGRAEAWPGVSAPANGAAVRPTGEKLADVIARSRDEIARCAGTPTSKVSIDIDWA